MDRLRNEDGMAMPAVYTVSVEEAQRMSLLGLLLKGFLERQLSSPRAARAAVNLRKTYRLHAGDMAVVLAFSEGGVTIRPAGGIVVHASLGGPMHELVGLVREGGLPRAMLAVLSGRLRIGGSVLALLALLPIMLSKAELPPNTTAGQS